MPYLLLFVVFCFFSVHFFLLSIEKHERIYKNVFYALGSLTSIVASFLLIPISLSMSGFAVAIFNCFVFGFVFSIGMIYSIIPSCRYCYDFISKRRK